MKNSRWLPYLGAVSIKLVINRLIRREKIDKNRCEKLGYCCGPTISIDLVEGVLCELIPPYTEPKSDETSP